MNEICQCSAPGFIIRHETFYLSFTISNFNNRFDTISLSEALGFNGIVNQRSFPTLLMIKTLGAFGSFDCWGALPVPHPHILMCSVTVYPQYSPSLSERY